MMLCELCGEYTRAIFDDRFCEQCYTLTDTLTDDWSDDDKHVSASN